MTGEYSIPYQYHISASPTARFTVYTHVFQAYLARLMAIKIDLHCHSFFSGDGVSSPEQLIEAARAKGLDGFAIPTTTPAVRLRIRLIRGICGPTVCGSIIR